MATFIIAKDPVQQQITVGDSTTKIPTTPITGRESMLVKNFAGETCFIGNEDVKITDGYPLEVGEILPFAIAQQANLYGRTESGEADIRILEAV